jgi:glutamate dehydrogenase/leucine dehydrogenase
MTLTGVSATTALGTLTVSPVTLTTLTGRAATTAQGTVATTQLTNASLVGLGESLTATVNGPGLILKYYGKKSPKVTTGYTNKTPKVTTGYTNKTPA